MLHYALIIVFPFIVVYAAITDFMTMTISNWLSLGLIVGFAVLAPLAGLSLSTVGWSIAAAGLVFALGFVFFLLNVMGGGDVKFASAVVLWIGWDHLFEYAMLFSIYGGLLTLAILSIVKLIEPLPILQVGFLSRFHEHRRVPYGIALSIAALQLYPATTLMQAA